MSLERFLKSLTQTKPSAFDFVSSFLLNRMPSYVSRRAGPFLALILVRLLIHFYRYDSLQNRLPWFDLLPLINLILFLQVAEALYSGALESLREKSRRLQTGSLVDVIRKWNFLSWLVVLGVTAYAVISILFPVLTTDRVLSVYDLIRIAFLLKFIFDLMMLPETSFLQGRTRLHYFRGAFFSQEAVSFLSLVVCLALWNVWGIVFSFLIDHAYRSFTKYFVLLRTRRNLEMKHSLFRVSWPSKVDLYNFRQLRLIIGCSLFSLGSRLESLVLFGYFNGAAEPEAFLFFPLLRASGDLPRLFVFDVMKERKKVHKIIAKAFLPRLFLISVSGGLLFFGFFSAAYISIGYSPSVDWFFYFLIFSISSPIFISLSYTWLRHYHRGSDSIFAARLSLQAYSNYILVKTRKSIVAKSIHLKWNQFLQQQGQVFRYQKNELIIASKNQVSDAQKSKLLILARGQVTQWKPLSRISFSLERDKSFLEQTNGLSFQADWLFFRSGVENKHGLTHEQLQEVVAAAIQFIETGLVQKLKIAGRSYRVFSEISPRAVWTAILIPAGASVEVTKPIQDELITRALGFRIGPQH